VYAATKAAVNVLSESLRVEGQGKIKVTVVKPTGVPATGLAATVVNMAAGVPAAGHSYTEFLDNYQKFAAGQLSSTQSDVDSPEYWAIEPRHIAEQVLHAIDQPWGVSIAEITVRATGENYIL
jgi:NADP-dependent 3-hydroxy acid dehydrogenase YdfG